MWATCEPGAFHEPNLLQCMHVPGRDGATWLPAELLNAVLRSTRVILLQNLEACKTFRPQARLSLDGVLLGLLVVSHHYAVLALV